MFEINATQVSTGTLYPNSGPGPKLLRAGTTKDGYFGSIDAEEFDFSSAVIDELPISGAYSFNNIPTKKQIWHKFFVDEKVLYVPEMPVFIVPNIDAISNAGMYSFSDHLGITDWRLNWPTATPQNKTVVVYDNDGKHVLGIRIGQPNAGATPGTFMMLDRKDEYSRTIARLSMRIGDLQYDSKSRDKMIAGQVTATFGVMAWKPSAADQNAVFYIYNAHTGTVSSHAGSTGVIPVLELATDLNITFAVELKRPGNDKEAPVPENNVVETSETVFKTGASEYNSASYTQENTALESGAVPTSSARPADEFIYSRERAIEASTITPEIVATVAVKPLTRHMSNGRQSSEVIQMPVHGVEGGKRGVVTDSDNFRTLNKRDEVTKTFSEMFDLKLAGDNIAVSIGPVSESFETSGGVENIEATHAAIIDRKMPHVAVAASMIPDVDGVTLVAEEVMIASAAQITEIAGAHISTDLKLTTHGAI